MNKLDKILETMKKLQKDLNLEGYIILVKVDKNDSIVGAHGKLCTLADLFEESFNKNNDFKEIVTHATMHKLKNFVEDMEMNTAIASGKVAKS